MLTALELVLLAPYLVLDIPKVRHQITSKFGSGQFD
jgi:hypothetical protein